MTLQDLLENERRLADLLPRLDQLLTGNPLAKAMDTARQQPNLLDPLALIMDNDAYYLSDGGYSRVLVRDTELRLSGVSRADVKARWGDPVVQRMVQQINTLLRTAYDDAMKSS